MPLPVEEPRNDAEQRHVHSDAEFLTHGTPIQFRIPLRGIDAVEDAMGSLRSIAGADYRLSNKVGYGEDAITLTERPPHEGAEPIGVRNVQVDEGGDTHQLSHSDTVQCIAGSACNMDHIDTGSPHIIRKPDQVAE